ncbi:MAG TPA: cyclase family protein [candidate division Zixibacteria bacterium]|nr:cyclase family protein [candidate division Zixibacteria bacterium]
MTESSSELIDLSHVVEHGLVTYKGLPPPSIGDYLSREDSRNVYAGETEFHIGKIEMVANTGTYVDSPYHRFAGGADLAEMPLENFANLDGIVIRIDPGKGRSIDLGDENLHQFKGKAVLFHTGWSAHWKTDQYFEGYPYLTKQAATILRDSGAVMVGIDSVNIDDNRDGMRPVHTILLEAGIPIVEHLSNLDQLPDRGFRFFATPVKVRSLGSFPVRAFALLSPERKP